MNTIYQYLQSGRVIDSYLKNIELIHDESEYQHFMSRLSLVDSSIELSREIFDLKITELDSLFKSNPDEVYKQILDQDSNGYIKELDKVITPELKQYLYNCRILDDVCILKRNHTELLEELQSKIKRFLNGNLVEFMCRVSKNKDLRELEGTLCVNGIGYMLYLFDNETLKKQIIKAFIDLYKYYLEKVDKEGLANRNFVYGLTHCVINVSDFYTKNINNWILYFQDTYPIGELYDRTAYVIGNSLDQNTKTESSLSTISSDMLAELLVVYKLLLNDYPSNKYYDFGYVISRAYNELVSRIDPVFEYIRDHKEENLKEDLKRNEHTNILFILYSRL